jgi:hypothetical protein
LNIQGFFLLSIESPEAKGRQDLFLKGETNEKYI